ncbi:MAG: DUF2079 domain-containing protein [Chloroflexota bacterium]
MTVIATSHLRESARSGLRLGRSTSTVLALALGIGYWLIVSWIAIAEYETYNSTSRDLGVYLQVIWNTAHGSPFTTTLLEHNRLHVAEHLAGLLALLAPLYRAVPDPRLLFLLQQAAIAATGAPIFLWARHRLGPARAVLILACYFAMPTLGEVALDAFYPVVFTALPLGFAAYFALRSRPALACVVSLIALPIEEEASLVAIGIGVYLAMLVRPRRWGIALTTIALGWGILATSLVMPRFHDPGTLSATGNRTAGHFDSLRTNPTKVASDLVQRRLPLAAEWLLLPTGGIAFFAPRVIAIAAPEIGALLFADNEGRYRRHWVAPALPIIWLATVSGIARLDGSRARITAMGVVVVGSVTSFVIDSSLPGGGTYEPYDTVWSPRSEQLQRALAEVPETVPVASSRRTLAYLANRSELYVYPPNYSGGLWPVTPAPRYWMFDLTNDQTREHLAGRSSPLRTQTGASIWTTGSDAALLTPESPTLARPSHLEWDWIRLNAWEVRDTREGLELILHWESTRRPPRPQLRSIRLLDPSANELHRIVVNPLDTIYPTNEWPRGQQWFDRTLPGTGHTGARIQVGWAERGGAPQEWIDVGVMAP